MYGYYHILSVSPSEPLDGSTTTPIHRAARRACRRARAQSRRVAIETAVRLRASPALDARALRSLREGDTLALVTPDSLSEDLLFLHVVSPFRDTGWVSTTFAHRIRRPTRPVRDSLRRRGHDRDPTGVDVHPGSITAIRRDHGCDSAELWNEVWHRTVAVKTLTDEDEPEVDYTPISTTITRLRKLVAPENPEDDKRSGDPERSTYRVTARLIAWKEEVGANSDRDIHLVLALLSNRN